MNNHCFCLVLSMYIEMFPKNCSSANLSARVRVVKDQAYVNIQPEAATDRDNETTLLDFSTSNLSCTKYYNV